MSKSVQWIPEKEAAQKVNRRPYTLRRLVKSGKWPIAYTAPNQRGYQYNLKDIDRLLESFSTL
jgi:hypothetical protein